MRFANVARKNKFTPLSQKTDFDSPSKSVFFYINFCKSCILHINCKAKKSPMLLSRKSKDRGKSERIWLTSYHSFSFGEYYDENHMGFRALRVINEDTVAPSRGFPPHSHDNMEILTYIIQGELQHQDSTGSKVIIKQGDVQLMSAGSGITHSEYNASSEKPVHLLQIWIHPDKDNLTPSHYERTFPKKPGEPLHLLASKEGKEGSLQIHQDVLLYRLILGKNESFAFPINPNRFIWVQIVKGPVLINGNSLDAGDGLQVSEETILSFEAIQDTELLLFDLA
jgi:redox-sensitive bicupin YhaK (pirin superfamily)